MRKERKKEKKKEEKERKERKKTNKKSNRTMSDDYDSDKEITNQDDAWPVVEAFFQEMKLVGQQVDSFDRFIETMMPGIIEDDNYLELYVEQQYSGHENEGNRKIEIHFGAVTISPPSQLESDGSVCRTLNPNIARLRNLT